VAPLLVGAAASAPTAVDSLAGRYYRQFPNALVTGEKYTGENIVEIVPVAGSAAYVRIHLDYFNGHSCSLFGIAKAEGRALVYRDPGETWDGRPCVLRIRRSGRDLSIDDGGGTCSDNCGARGTLSEIALPFASRRQITYMNRLKASPEYRQAISEWHQKPRTVAH